MRETVRINHGDHIKSVMVGNLMSAHKRICDKGTAREVIELSQYILKVSNSFKKKFLELGLEEHYLGDEQPPNESQDDV